MKVGGKATAAAICAFAFSQPALSKHLRTLRNAGIVMFEQHGRSHRYTLNGDALQDAADWLLNGPMKASGFRPVTPTIEASAELPRFFPDPLRFNWGFVLALVVAYLVYWFLCTSRRFCC